MTLINSHYFKLNKLLLTFCGLWPYQTKLKRRINYTTFAIITLSMIFSLAGGIQSELNTGFMNISESIIALLFFSTGFLKCTIFYNQRNQLKILYEQTAHDLKKMTHHLERDILQAFLLEARNFNVVSLVYSIPIYIVFAIATYLPQVFGFTNESAKYELHFFLYYKPMIIHESVQDLQVLIHATISTIYVGSAYLCVSATYISSVKHVCALFEIARYRLKNVIVDHSNNNRRGLMKNASVISNLIKVIDIHEKALRGVQRIDNVFNASLFILEVTALSAVTILIFHLNYHQGNFRQMTRYSTILSAFVSYLFFCNWFGEQVIQSCNDIRETAYNVNWYNMSLRARMFVLMIMQRTLKPVHLTAGTVVILSMENFSAFLKTAWSFGTLLLTTQKPSPKENSIFFEY
ncbi:odorant receptor 183 [Nasonia vitripennis]|uniref:Odorant receptor n=1 Tax=Nasonia vitripennis TaxID=7425 RepID=A0A7M6UW86_NASVI|nr:odorant receptor 183 [Nasonia vitripennis]